MKCLQNNKTNTDTLKTHIIKYLVHCFTATAKTLLAFSNENIEAGT